MIRGDNIICGTTTTGTGTLTLAACPTPPGGVDFDVLARAYGFANSKPVTVSYTIIEYIDATFGTAKSQEKGIGVVTLGSSAGIANCTLTRSVKQTSATSLNSQPATYNFMPATGISIGTAANTLVFVGPSSTDVPAYLPYYNTSITNGMVSPVGSQSVVAGVDVITNKRMYTAFDWRIPMLVKQCFMGIWGNSTGVTHAYAALYSIGPNGRPNQLLIDFGELGVPNASLNVAFVPINSAVHSTGFFMTPGEYIFSLILVIEAGGTAGTFQVYDVDAGTMLNIGRMGAWNGGPTLVSHTDTSGPTTPAPDPAYVSGYAFSGTMSTPVFGFGTG